MLSKQLKEQKDIQNGIVEKNKEYEKHLAKSIRDNQMLLKLAKLRGKAAIDAHPFGPKMAKLMSSRGAMNYMGIIGLLGNVMGMLGKLVSGVFNAFFGVLKKIWSTWLEIQTLTGNISADMGQTFVQTQQISNNIGQIAFSAAQWGVNIEEALSFMTSFANITGRNRIFLEDDVSHLSAIAKATGLGARNTGEMYAHMEMLGYSTATFHSYVEKTRNMAGRLGLNITKILTTVKALLPAYNALNFKGGVQDLTDMVMKAQGLRFELNNMRNLAVQVFTPEGAIELAAKLRILGGEYAKIADPFSLMLKGQTDPKGLMDDVLKAISNVAIRGKDGMFSIPPVQQALIREFAQMTGESVDNLTRTALEARKQQAVIGRLQTRGMFNEEDILAVAHLAEWDAEKKDYMIKVDVHGTRKAISEINSSFSIFEKMHGMIREEREVATSRMNLVEQLKNLRGMLFSSMLPMFRPLEALFKDTGLMAKLHETMKDLGNFIGDKLSPLFSSGGDFYTILENTSLKIKEVVTGFAEILEGKGSFFTVLAHAAGFLVTEVLDAVIPKIKELLVGVGQSGIGGAVKQGAGLLAAMTVLGPAITMAAPTFGASLLLPVAAYFAGEYAAGQIMSPADDFIMRSNGQIQQFNKDDLVIGGTSLAQKPNEQGAPMVSSRSLLEQVNTYEKSQFTPLNIYVGGGESKAPANIQLNMSGSVEIKGNDQSVYLTNEDLKNVGIQHLTYLVLKETDRYKNHTSNKRLPSEIIRPIT
jgi:hypothetical protein